MSEEEEYTSEGEEDEGDIVSDIPSGLSEEVVPKVATPLTSISSDDTSALSSVGGASCSLQKLSFNDGALNDPDGKPL